MFFVEDRWIFCVCCPSHLIRNLKDLDLACENENGLVAAMSETTSWERGRSLSIAVLSYRQDVRNMDQYALVTTTRKVCISLKAMKNKVDNNLKERIIPCSKKKS